MTIKWSVCWLYNTSLYFWNSSIHLMVFYMYKHYCTFSFYWIVYQIAAYRHDKRDIKSFSADFRCEGLYIFMDDLLYQCRHKQNSCLCVHEGNVYKSLSMDDPCIWATIDQLIYFGRVSQCQNLCQARILLIKKIINYLSSMWNQSFINSWRKIKSPDSPPFSITKSSQSLRVFGQRWPIWR